VTLTNR